MRSRRPRRIAFPLAWSAITLLACVPLRAQIAGRSLANAAEADSVGARSRANYDALGIPVGGFRLYASTDLDFTYSDNIYETETRRRSDIFATLAPRVELRSQSPGRDLVLHADAAILRYNKLHAENNEQYNLAADGRLTLRNSIDLALGGFYGRRTELRGTLGDVVIGAPNQYDQSGGRAGVLVRLVNLVLAADGNIESFDYKPVRFNRTTVLQDYRDRTIYSGTIRSDFQVGPGLLLFAQGRYNRQRYPRRFAGQNSRGYSALGGVRFGLTELVSGELGIGYLSQTYRQGTDRTVDGLSYSGKIVWNPTTLITATFAGGRTLEPSPFFNQGGVLQDNLSVSLDYELLRNLIISGFERRTVSDYKGQDRRDRLNTVGASGRLLINRTIETGLQVEHRHQSSSGTFTRRYTGTNAMLSFTIKR